MTLRLALASIAEMADQSEEPGRQRASAGWAGVDRARRYHQSIKPDLVLLIATLVLALAIAERGSTGLGRY